jgi:nucleotide-binding universal stress UspA family protein
MACYDGSKASERAIDLAGAQAKLLDARLFLLTSMIGGSDERAEDITEAENRLNIIQSRMADEAISCETHLLIRGLSAGEDLVQFAQENEIDQIFIGIEKKSKVGKLLFGSTAQYVILEAHCPVVTVKE